MARAIKFGSHLKELRLHLCQNSEPSKAAREFVEKYYISLKQSNPRFPILIRECAGVQPKLWARYEGGKENSVSLSSFSRGEEVLKQVELLAK